MIHFQYDRHSYHEGAKIDIEQHARWRIFKAMGGLGP